MPIRCVLERLNLNLVRSLPCRCHVFAKASMRPAAALRYRSHWPHYAAFALLALLVHEPENCGDDHVGRCHFRTDGAMEVPRSRQRICLQEGLKLDINLLIRRGLIAPGSASSPHAIRWVNSDGEVIASGWINADMKGETEDRKSTRLNSSHLGNSYAVFCLKKKI